MSTYYAQESNRIFRNRFREFSWSDICPLCGTFSCRCYVTGIQNLWSILWLPIYTLASRLQWSHSSCPNYVKGDRASNTRVIVNRIDLHCSLTVTFTRNNGATAGPYDGAADTRWVCVNELRREL